MIKSFFCKETEKIWLGKYSRKLPQDIQERALRKLRQLNASNTLEDLKIPPGNHLEALSGDRLGEYSIRINKQWRLCFKWQNSHVYNVEIVDYHLKIMSEKLIKNPSAGEILKEDFLEELGISKSALADAIDVSSNHIDSIINNTHQITADIDLRLCIYFGLSEGYFLRLQNNYELMEAKRKLGEKLNKIIPLAR